MVVVSVVGLPWRILYSGRDYLSLSGGVSRGVRGVYVERLFVYFVKDAGSEFLNAGK